MQLYNTMTRKKEELVPVRPGKIGMYACGITAYDYSHIGHARSAVAFDVLVRYLRHLGLDVTFIRNFTDVDDKIIARANKEGRTSEAISKEYIAAFHEDMDRLGVTRPDIEPLATEHIDDMIHLCATLIDKGKAYAAKNGDVYFRVREFPEYGKLSGRNPDEMRAGARIAPGEEKEDPMDFALWKAAKPGEPHWSSPWGEGRPGWHIECSAMSKKYLPLPLDIHGGGLDLIFPHHENEIAQTEAATGQIMAKTWVHNGFVQINSEKMSKSLGNFKTIRDILDGYLPETLRLFLIGKHYRSPIDFSFDAMDETERAQKRVYETLRDITIALKRDKWKKVPDEGLCKELATLSADFLAALDDDCNTAAALGHVFGMIHLTRRILEDKSKRVSESGRDVMRGVLEQSVLWNKILGVFGSVPDMFLNDLKTIRIRRRNIDVSAIERLLGERAAARTAKDFAKSDELRTALAELGADVRDTPEGQQWDLG